MMREFYVKCGPTKMGALTYLKRRGNKSCVYFFLRGLSLPCERVRVFVVNQNRVPFATSRLPEQVLSFLQRNIGAKLAKPCKNWCTKHIRAGTAQNPICTLTWPFSCRAPKTRGQGGTSMCKALSKNGSPRRKKKTQPLNFVFMMCCGNASNKLFKKIV